MNDEDSRKRLEIEARKLILAREISPQDREKINSIMRDNSTPPEEKYKAIIRLLRRAPVKTIDDKHIDTEEEPNSRKDSQHLTERQAKKEKQKVAIKGADIYSDVPDTRRPMTNGPTETSLYIDDIYIKYRRFKLFKKRRLVQRNNWLGLGFRKRLIPAKNFFVIINHIRKYQSIVLSKLSWIIDAILKREDMESPVVYNHLKILRRWITSLPFQNIPQSRIKWMEQWDFERELKGYVINHYAFLKIDLNTRNEILAVVEEILRSESESNTLDADEDIPQRGKNNYLKEKEIYDYMGALRSFITIPGEGDSLLAMELKEKHDIYSITEFLNMSMEALVFQRPFAITELRAYYDIRPVAVSSEIWDCSPEKLKAYGKDPESKRQKRIERLKDELVWHDIVYRLVNLDDGGESIIQKAAESQWKFVDRINRDPDDVFKNNFIVLLEGALFYFKNLLSQMIDGSNLILEGDGKEIETPIFLEEYFKEEMLELDNVLNEFFSFRNNNPTLKIQYEEVKKIMMKKISSLDHVERLIYRTGSLFYSIAKKLCEVYYNHIKRDQGQGKLLKPLGLSGTGVAEAEAIPFAGYILKSISVSTPLMKKIIGQKILTDSGKGGIYIFLMAFCYQMAYLADYPLIKDDLSKREMIKRELKALKGDEL